MMMTYTYKMEIGDWSHDGHNQSEVFVLETSHKNTEIQKAYARACKNGDIALHGHGENSILSNYEDSSISPENCEKLEKLGINISDLSSLSSLVNDDGSLCCCGPKDVVILFMEMAKTQLPKLTYKIVSDKMEEIQAPKHAFMGYGCF